MITAREPAFLTGQKFVSARAAFGGTVDLSGQAVRIIAPGVCFESRGSKSYSIGDAQYARFPATFISEQSASAHQTVAGGDTVRVNSLLVQAFRPVKISMLVAIRKAHHFIFDRRTVTRADPSITPGVHRAAIEVIADHFMGFSLVYVIWHGICSGCSSALPMKENTGHGLSPNCGVS